MTSHVCWQTFALCSMENTSYGFFIRRTWTIVSVAVFSVLVTAHPTPQETSLPTSADLATLTPTEQPTSVADSPSRKFPATVQGPPTTVFETVFVTDGDKVVPSVSSATYVNVVVETSVIRDSQVIPTTIVVNTRAEDPVVTQRPETHLVTFVTESVSYKLTSLTVPGGNAASPSVIVSSIPAATVTVTAVTATTVLVNVSGSDLGGVSGFTSSSDTMFPNSTQPPSSSSSNKKLTAGTVVGIVTGVLALVILIIFLLYRKSRKWRSHEVGNEARDVNPFMTESELNGSSNGRTHPFVNTSDDPFLDPFTADPPPMTEDGHILEYSQTASIPVLLRTPISRSPKEDPSAFPAAGRLSSYPRSSSRSRSQHARNQSGSQENTDGENSRKHSRAGSSVDDTHDRSSGQRRERAMSDADMDRLVKLIASRSNVREDPFNTPSDKLPPEYSDDGTDLGAGGRSRGGRRSERDIVHEPEEPTPSQPPSSSGRSHRQNA
ncbi:hypothetical protein FRC03_011336 [Tulasnella sp. 419]|nr:hypothetical protein FRC03_011336 [Tulasnella sp. 419]